MNYLFLLESTSTMCDKLSTVWTIFGYIIWAIKVVVPILLIISGMITMAKAVMEKDEKAIKSAQQLLIKKVIAAVIVYLVIVLTGVIINLVADDSWETCAKCAFHPFSNGCGIETVPTTGE